MQAIEEELSIPASKDACKNRSGKKMANEKEGQRKMANQGYQTSRRTKFLGSGGEENE